MQWKVLLFVYSNMLLGRRFFTAALGLVL